MSSLKRSNSSSNIPRLSRISVRQSNISRAPRSSSTRSSGGSSNLLTVCGSGVLGRSSSHSNLVTPSRRLQPQTPSSTASSASKNFRMNDKEWQKTQTLRVKHFLCYHDPEMPPIKPLSIRTYIHSMNILLKQLDSRISITPENFKESVSEYLKSFKYPYTIKQSVIKSPAVPTSWQYILQIWIWLLDLIELLQNPERVLLPDRTDQMQRKLFYTCVNYLADRFVAFNRTKDEKTVDEDFVNNLVQVQSIDLDTFALLQSEVRLDSQLKSLNDVEQSTTASIQEVTEKVKELSENNAIHIQNMHDRRYKLLTNIKELSIQRRNIDIELNEGLQRKKQLEAVIAAQPCTKREVKKLKDKIEEIRNREQLKQQCLKEQAKTEEDYCSKINHQKFLIQSTILKTNNSLAVLSCKAPELKGLKMPDDEPTDPNFKRHLKEFTDKMIKVDADLKVNLEDVKTQFNKKQQEHRTNILRKEELDVEMEKIIQIGKERMNTHSKKKDILHEKLKKAQLEVVKLEKELDILVLQRPDDKIKEEYEVSLKQQEELKHLHTETLARAQKLLAFVRNKLTDTIHDQMDKMEKINAAERKQETEAGYFYNFVIKNWHFSNK